MLESIIGILTGGATGLLGTLITFGVDFFKRKQEHKHEIELRRVDLEISRAESESAERIAAAEAESEESGRAWRALEASYRASTTRWSRGDSKWLVLVDVIRGLTRPALTWGFVFLTGCIYFFLSEIDGPIRVRIIETVLYLTTTCVTWWFGARQVAKVAK